MLEMVYEMGLIAILIRLFMVKTLEMREKMFSKRILELVQGKCASNVDF